MVTIFRRRTLLLRALADKIKKIQGAKDITISRDKSKPELQIIFDQNKMIANGLNTAMASSAIKNRVEGLTATRLRQFGDEYDVVVRFKRSATSTLTDVENIGITNQAGQMIRLGEIAQIKEYWAPPSIERKRKERIVTVSFTPYKRSLTDIQTDVQKAIDETSNACRRYGTDFRCHQGTDGIFYGYCPSSGDKPYSCLPYYGITVRVT